MPLIFGRVPQNMAKNLAGQGAKNKGSGTKQPKVFLFSFVSKILAR